MGLAGRGALGSPVHGYSLSPEGTQTGGLEAVLGHRFARPELLSEALTHRSALQARRGRGVSNERLEFIGDRVLGLVIAEWLAERFPGEHEGQLGPRLAHLVSQPVLATIAEAVGLGAAISAGEGEARAGVKRRATVLADALEATIGALYFDGGLDAARGFVRSAWNDAVTGQPKPPTNAKSDLQEWALARGLPLPRYELAERCGPPHEPRFLITVSLAGMTGRGEAGSKRSAEQAAAADLLAALTA